MLCCADASYLSSLLAVLGDWKYFTLSLHLVAFGYKCKNVVFHFEKQLHSLSSTFGRDELQSAALLTDAHTFLLSPCFLIWVTYFVGDWVIPFLSGLQGFDEHLALAVI